MSGLAVLAGAVLSASTTSGHVILQELIERTPQSDGTTRVRRERMTVYLAGDKARIEREDGTALVVDLGKQVTIELDTVVRSYKRLTFKQRRAQREMLDADVLDQIAAIPLGHPRRAESVDRLTDSPEKWDLIYELPAGEPRAALLRKYRLPEEPPKVEVRAAEETKEIAAQKCRRYEALEDGKVRDWAYVAVRLPFDKRYYEFMQLVGWIGRELAKGLEAASGLPLHTIMHVRDGGEIEIRTESVTPRELDEALFDVPDGYRKRQKEKASFR
ncbi:MAG: hypothetical protein ACYSU0_20965 [Planctomycetota bacterium]